MYKKVEKPWGAEYWLVSNDKLVMKKLFIEAGHKTSLQYHEKKHECIYVLDGELKFTVGDNVDSLTTIILHPGDYIDIPPKLIHRMEGVLSSNYLEASTIEVDDVIRLEDVYGR